MFPEFYFLGNLLIFHGGLAVPCNMPMAPQIFQLRTDELIIPHTGHDGGMRVHLRGVRKSSACAGEDAVSTLINLASK